MDDDDEDVNNHSFFDQYCISHNTISPQAAAAPGSEVPPWVPDDLISSFVPPRNKSWRRHWLLP